MGSKRDLDEIEVDLTAPKPLNKKQKRLLKKGKIEEPQPEDINASKPKPRSAYAVWIGNLSFETTTDGLRDFIIESTAKLDSPITREDITRIKFPSKRGFAYVDVKTEDQMKELIGLSESRLDGRNLLIKSANSFEGRPEEHAESGKNPPSRILFVGNLSFDTTDEQIEMQFQHCGEIKRIRTATFQDTGKCKGFTFIDFRDEEAATKALKDPSCRKLNGRTLRMEYGEDRSKRRPKREENNTSSGEQNVPSSSSSSSSSSTAAPSNGMATNESTRSQPALRTRQPSKKVGKARPTPGAALSGAMRGKQSIVPSAGKKVTFD